MNDKLQKYARLYSITIKKKTHTNYPRQLILVLYFRKEGL